MGYREENQYDEIRDMLNEFITIGAIDVDMGYALIGAGVVGDYLTEIAIGDSGSVAAKDYTFEYRVTDLFDLELEWEV
ncbi:MAG: hypothetical protein ACRC0G_15870 [Fusobacteriaceae bacterium]